MKIQRPQSLLEGPLDEPASEYLATAMKALSDPVRLRILSLLATAPTGELCACHLPEAVMKSQPTVSHHLTQLVAAGLVHREQRGKWAWFRLNVDALASVRLALGEGSTRRPARRAVVLFLCVHNAGRSQMAAGFMRHLGGDRVEVWSAGSAPGEKLNPHAVAAMREVGIDISGAKPRRWTKTQLERTDVVVSMGCGDECPVYPGTRTLTWDLDDPAGQNLEFVRTVRDQIEDHVRQLLHEIAPGCC